MRPSTKASRQLTHPRPLPSPPVVKRTRVGRWVRSESFWQDVASRALSGVLVGLAGLAVAAGSGFIEPNIAIRIGASLTIVIGLFTAGYVIVTGMAKELVEVITIYRRRWELKVSPEKAYRRAMVLFMVVVMFVSLLVVVLGLMLAALLIGLVWFAVPVVP